MRAATFLAPLVLASTVMGLYNPIRKRTSTLTHRDETETVWELFSNGQYVTLSGTGYIRCRWEVEYWKGAGSMTYPTFTDSTGTFISVAAGGGYEQSDEPPSCYDSDDVCSNYTGSTNYGYSWFTDLANPYQNEYYYLGGEITITNLEGDGKYNVGVTHITYAAMFADVNTAPTGSQGET